MVPTVHSLPGVNSIFKSSIDSKEYIISPKSNETDPTLELLRLNISSDSHGMLVPSYHQKEVLPAYVFVIIGAVFLVMSGTFFYYLCRCLSRRRKRQTQLSEMTPKGPYPRLAGVLADQPIQFVVPTTTTLVTTEDSVSETDYSSSSGLPVLTGDRRRRRSPIAINPADLEHGLYAGLYATDTQGNAYLGDLGRVGFSLSYNRQRSQLKVRLIGAKDLPCHFLRTTANPRAKLVLMPDKTAKYMTKVHRNTVSPEFEECFTFCVRPDDLVQKHLKVSLWDYDRFSRKCLIGQILYPVKDSGLLTQDNTTGDIWVNLKPDTPTAGSGNGELLFSLCYDPDAAHLTVTLLKARGLLLQTDKDKDLAVYAKVSLYVRRKLSRVKKTPSRPKTPQVTFSEASFEIWVPPKRLGELDLLVTLCERSTGLGGPRGRALGRTQVGVNCLCDQGLQHWSDMLLSPKSTCAQWHVLWGP